MATNGLIGMNSRDYAHGSGMGHDHARLLQASAGEPLLMTTSDESTPASSLAQRSPRDAGVWAQVRPYLDRVGPSLDLLVKMIAVGWSLSLLAGGLIFLVYFSAIGFMPEMNLKAFATVLVFSAPVGGFLLILLSAFLLASGLWWRYWVTSSETLKSLVYNEQKAWSRRAALWFAVPLGCAIAGFFILDLTHIKPPECGTAIVALIPLAISLLSGLLITAVLLWIAHPDHLQGKQ